MASTRDAPYSLSIDLNVLQHLGIYLYSNVPAVLSEVVANAWDADATEVDIVIESDEPQITITDNGIGMTRDDVNNRYLHVGYQKRDQPGGGVTAMGRPVMGRKGIGKLSLFSTANIVDLQTIKDGQRNALRMKLSDIEALIRKNPNATYNPQPLPTDQLTFDRGTTIVLRALKKSVSQTPAALRRRIARRFSILGDKWNFKVRVNGDPIGLADRDYFHKIQYLWHYGDDARNYVSECKNLEYEEARSGIVDESKGYMIRGWIGTAHNSGNLREGNESLNKISILVRGKLAQEDVLETFTEGGVYSKYVIGEIDADFLDLDDKDDIATTSRQHIIEDDDRYQSLRQFLEPELKNIQAQWTTLRKDTGVKKAEEIPAIKEWMAQLGHDDRVRAGKLFGRINQLDFETEADRRELFVHGVLAFEHLRYKSQLDALDELTPGNLGALSRAFLNLDDIEASLYHQIVKGRVSFIEALSELVDENAKEKLIQEHLFEHLWLLDNSWERAAGSDYMEQRLIKEFEEVDVHLNDNERMGRVDIKYKTAAGKHIIVELKRPERVITQGELVDQVTKYFRALRSLLTQIGTPHDPIEIVCVIGQWPDGWAAADDRDRGLRSLSEYNTRVIHYQELIDRSFKANSEYLEKHKEAGRISKLIAAIRQVDNEEMTIEVVLRPDDGVADEHEISE